MEREYMEFDVVIVGAGPCRSCPPPAGLKQKAAKPVKEISVCVVEKVPKSAHTFSPARYSSPAP